MVGADVEAVVAILSQLRLRVSLHVQLATRVVLMAVLEIEQGHLLFEKFVLRFYTIVLE